MVEVIGIIIGVGTAVLMWKILGLNFNADKSKIWGASIATGIFVTILFYAYYFHMLNRPFTYIMAVPLTFVAYITNKNYYKNDPRKNPNIRKDSIKQK